MDKIFRKVKIGVSVVIGVFAGFLCLELLLVAIYSTPLKKVFPVITPQLGRPDQDTGYSFIPNRQHLWTKENRAEVQINSLGHRDFEVSKKKQFGTYRINLSGDSMVEGLQVENQFTFDNIAEARLKKKHRNVEIVNLAMSGNGPLRQLVRLEKFGVPLKANRTLMMISAPDFITGEMKDDSQNPGYRVVNDQKVERSYTYRERISQRINGTIFGEVFFGLLEFSSVTRLIFNKRSTAPLDLLGLPVSVFTSSVRDSEVALVKCASKVIDDLYVFWTRKEPKDDWLVTHFFFQELKQYQRHSDSPIDIGLLLPRANNDCPELIKKRNIIINEMTNISNSFDIGMIDWHTLVDKKLYKMQEVESPKQLRGFGLTFGEGHLNYLGHSVYSEVLADYATNLVQSAGR